MADPAGLMEPAPKAAQARRPEPEAGQSTREPAARPSSADVANEQQARHGNAAVANAAVRTQVPATEKPATTGPATANRVAPAAATRHAAPAGVPRAEDLIAAKYPQLARVLLPAHFKAVQEVINWRLQNRNLNEEIADFDRRERETATREGMEGNSYRYLGTYNDKLEKLYSKQKEAPGVTKIEVDTSMLIDRSILDGQDWNIDAERQFRESWVRALSSKPTILELWGDHPIENVFRGVFWNGVSLPTEGGLITWKKLLEIPGAFLDYNSRVLRSPVAVGAEEYLGKLRSVYGTVESEYDFERERKSGFPIVSRISEFFSSSIDWNAASKLLPRGKSFDDMNPFETMEFLGSLKEEQVDRVSRVLPTWEEVLKVYKHLLNVNTAVTLRKYEAALITMPLVADEIEEIYRKTMTYRQRTLEGASTVVTGLQYVRVGCNIVLTVGGGVMGKAYGIIGISAGSAAGAGIGTLTQETAMQLAEGRLDPGSVLFKTGKDAAMAFIGSMIGGALAGKFASILGTRLATIIPNAAVRAFVIGRIADAGSGLLTAPLEITVNGMLEGDWPKSMEDLAEKVATNVAVSVVVGGALDIVTRVPNLKGKEWKSLTEAELQIAVAKTNPKVERSPATTAHQDPQHGATVEPAPIPKATPRVTDPVPGLYGSIDPSFKPLGWSISERHPIRPHPDHPELVQIATDVIAPDKSTGWIQRSYDPKTKKVVMENAFLDKLPSWIEAGTPMVPGKGTPTVTYLTLRQLKQLGVVFGNVQSVKMSTIQNVEAVMQLAQMTRPPNSLPLEKAVAKTHSVSYATTSIEQSGHTIVDVRIDTKDAFQWKLQDMMDYFKLEPAKRQELFAKYGLGADDKVLVNYDISIDVAPHPANPTN